MDQALYKLVYCSRNRIQGSSDEVAGQIQSILASSRTNNPRLKLTGALLYNSGNFAQILEGPLASVDRIFEKIQRDDRHGEAIVIHSGPTTERDFPDWSMAFAGSDTITPLASVAFDAAFARSDGAGERMMALLKDLVVREND